MINERLKRDGASETAAARVVPPAATGVLRFIAVLLPFAAIAGFMLIHP
jgi:hypothetical protein